MAKRIVRTNKDGTASTKIELHKCEKLQLEKGDQAADKAWSNKGKVAKSPANKKVEKQ